MTEEEYKNATDAEKILYDCTGMLGENHPAIIEAMEKLANQRQEVVPHDTVVSLPFTDEQLKVIGLALEAFLKEDTVIVDDNNKVHDEMVITLRNDAQGIGYYLGLEDVKPKYFKGTN